jgi:hypothetical protein
MAENEQKTPKKFRVRFREYETPDLINNTETIEYGDLFIENRSLGARVLQRHGTPHGNKQPRALMNIYNQNGFNFVDSGLHVIDAKEFAPADSESADGKVKCIDLKEYTESGMYYIRGEAISNKGGVVLKNSPYGVNAISGADKAGYLQVIEWNSDYCKQIFLKQGSEQIFVREKMGGNWSAWKEILTSNFFGNQNPTEKLKESKSKSVNGNPDINYFTDFGVYYFNAKEEHYAENKPSWYVNTQGEQILTYEEEEKYMSGTTDYFMRHQNGFLMVLPMPSGEIIKQFWHGVGGEGDLTFVRHFLASNRTWSDWTLLNNQSSLPLNVRFKLPPSGNTGLKPENEIDFNNFRTSGFYWFSVGSGNTARLKNRPPKATNIVNGFLQVISLGNFTRQIIFRGGSFDKSVSTLNNTADEIWIRTILTSAETGATTYGSWGKIALTLE